MTKRSFACWVLIEQSQMIHKSCFIVVMLRANGVECNLRRMTILISCPKEAHCMRMKEWPILMKDTILPSASTAMRG